MAVSGNDGVISVSTSLAASEGAECVERVLRRLRFPRFSNPSTALTYFY